MRGKKIISILLLLSLILSISSFQSIYAEEAVTEAPYASEYQDEIDFLKKIKILDEAFSPSASITKAELVKMAITMLHPDLDFSTLGDYQGAAFYDVPVDHTYYPYIKVAKDMKIVYGDAYGNFNPDSLITVTDALTVMINALGYTLYADAFGGHPTGYYSVASKTGISKGVKITAESTKADVVAKIIYNAMFADISGIKYVDDGGISIAIEEGKNLLSKRLDIYEYTAKVIDSGVSALNGNSINDAERVVIEDIVTGRQYAAYANGTDIGKYLGYTVKVFIRNNTEAARSEVVHFYTHKNVKTLSLKSPQILNTTASYVEYEETKDAMNVLKLNFGDVRPILIFNGVRLKENTLEEVMPKDGIITFIDNDNNNQYDLVSVLSFNYDGVSFDAPARNIVVSSVVIDEGFESISCLINPKNFLDLNPQKYTYSFTKESSKDMLRTISTNEIVSVAQAPGFIDGKIYYYLTVSSDSAKGSIDAVVDDNKIEVAGTVYDLSSSLTYAKPTIMTNLVSGLEITASVDITGKIAHVDYVSSIIKNYGYLTSATVKTEVEKVLNVKLFTKLGLFGVYEVSPKATIDGVAYTSPQKQLDALRTKDDMSGVPTLYDASDISRPVIYEMNSKGVITKIDTDNPNMDNSVPNGFYQSQTYIKYSDEEVADDDALKAGFRSLRMTDYTNNGTMDGKFYINNNTFVINVPDIDRAGIKKYEYLGPGSSGPEVANAKIFDERLIEYKELPKYDENYRVINTGALSASYRYDLQGYDIDPVTGVAGLVVVRGRMDVHDDTGISTSGTAYPMYVYLKKTEVYDETLEKTLTKIYYTKEGSEVLSVLVDLDECYYIYKYLIEGCAAGDTPWGVAVNPLKTGDIIRVFKKSNGMLDHLERILEVRKDLSNNYSCFELYEHTAYPYSKNTQSPTQFPFDGPGDSSSPSASTNIMLAPVKQISGTTVQFLIPANLRSSANYKISAMKLNDPTTYQTIFHTIAGQALTPVTVVEFVDDETVKVRLGTSSDITTLSETDNSYKGASMVLMRPGNFSIQQTIVLNNLEVINNDPIMYGSN